MLPSRRSLWSLIPGVALFFVVASAGAAEPLYVVFDFFASFRSFRPDPRGPK
jgi:hypothetical protein